MKYLKGKITLGESRRRGFVCKVGDYSIHDVGSAYVVTNKYGRAVYETKWGIPFIRDYIEDCIAKGIEVGSEKPIKEAVGYDHYGAKDMEEIEGPCYIQYDGGARNIEHLRKARNGRWIWVNIGNPGEPYVFPTFQDALKVQERVGGEILPYEDDEDLTADELAYERYKKGEYTYQDYVDVCNQEECDPLPKLNEGKEEELPPVVPEEPIVVSSEVEGVDPVLENNAIASVINALIIDEFEAVEGYNNAISTLTAEDVVKYGDAIKVLNDILNEENIHIGQLQEVLKQVSDSASSIETGKEEAKDTLEGTEEVVDEPVQEEGLNESGIDTLARRMGNKLLPPKKTPKTRYVYEIYWFDTEDCTGDAIFKKFWTKKAQEEWYNAHKDDPDKFSMYMEDGYNMYEDLECNSKAVCINEEQGSMKEKVVNTTRNFTKEKGQIICSKGAQQEEVEALLKPHYSNVEVTKAKGGSVNIKYSK